jgi:hypothetical protein
VPLPHSSACTRCQRVKCTCGNPSVLKRGVNACFRTCQVSFVMIPIPPVRPGIPSSLELDAAHQTALSPIPRRCPSKGFLSFFMGTFYCENPQILPREGIEIQLQVSAVHHYSVQVGFLISRGRGLHQTLPLGLVPRLPLPSFASFASLRASDLAACIGISFHRRLGSGSCMKQLTKSCIREEEQRSRVGFSGHLEATGPILGSGRISGVGYIRKSEWASQPS